MDQPSMKSRMRMLKSTAEIELSRAPGGASFELNRERAEVILALFDELEQLRAYQADMEKQIQQAIATNVEVALTQNQIAELNAAVADVKSWPTLAKNPEHQIVKAEHNPEMLIATADNVSWQPIETAPKDTWMLVLTDRWPETGRHQTGGWETTDRATPTHWAPIPTLPKKDRT